MSARKLFPQTIMGFVINNLVDGDKLNTLHDGICIRKIPCDARLIQMTHKLRCEHPDENHQYRDCDRQFNQGKTVIVVAFIMLAVSNQDDIPSFDMD
jgi:hypothetical protein